jgi:hypothetical protein
MSSFLSKRMSVNSSAGPDAASVLRRLTAGFAGRLQPDKLILFSTTKKEID